MSVCRNEEMNKGGAYPRSCPSCGFTGKCVRGVKPDPASGIDPKYYIGDFNVDKYAVIYTDQIHHEGDERSRTNPGHGYPAYIENVEKIQIFPSEVDLIKWVKRNNEGYGRKTFKAIKYQELSVDTEVVVKLR